MDSWIGPALTAALVTAIVTSLGWLVSSKQARSAEVARRSERVRDFTMAIAAEMASNVDRFSDVDLEQHSTDMQNRILKQEKFTPLVPKYDAVMIFDELIDEIPILPHEVISATVDYYKSEYVLQMFVDDLRSEAFASRAQETKALMYADYIRLAQEAVRLGAHALSELNMLLKRRFSVEIRAKTRTPTARQQLAPAGSVAGLGTNGASAHDR